jgi:cold shock CspA family protein
MSMNILGRGAFRGAQLACRFKMTGTVKTFNPTKGFGFIIPADGSQGDVFVHQTNIKANGFRSLAVGEEVEYDIETRDGRNVAVNVTGPGGASVKGSPPRRDFDSRGDSRGGESHAMRSPRKFGRGEYSD